MFDDTTPLVEGISIDEAFLDVGGLRRRVGHAGRDRGAAARADVLERVGLPITVGVARTKFLAKVASGVAKPDGLLVVAARRRARVPAPARRSSGCGASGTMTADKLHDRGIDTVGEVARLERGALVSMLGPRVGSPPARARAQPRPAARAGRPAPALDRFAARARPAAETPRRDRRDSSPSSSTG